MDWIRILLLGSCNVIPLGPLKMKHVDIFSCICQAEGWFGSRCQETNIFEATKGP